MKLLINTLHKGRPFGAIFVGVVALIGIFAQSPAALCASDLIVTVVDSSSVVSDCQTLTADGTVSATVRNIGASGTLADFDVIFFEDANENGRFDPGADNVLGSATQSALAADEIVTVSWKRVRCHIFGKGFGVTS